MPGVVTSAAKADEPMDMGFNMDFDAPAVPAPKDDVPATDFSAEFASSGKDDLSGMGDLAAAFDIPQTPVSAAPAAPALDLGSMNFDLPSSASALSIAIVRHVEHRPGPASDRHRRHRTAGL
ncbi:hypothetical protein LP419_30515 [Massilia sp. H-1]|nr:hypothetical protein LP419_30515 [Massilia sp. H-1]